MPEYQCCLCGIVSANCTRKCFICGSKERRICDRCCASRNKCLECQQESSSNNINEQTTTANAPKRKKSVSFAEADNHDESSIGSGKSSKSSNRSKKTKSSQPRQEEAVESDSAAMVSQSQQQQQQQEGGAAAVVSSSQSQQQQQGSSANAAALLSEMKRSQEYAAAAAAAAILQQLQLQRRQQQQEMQRMNTQALSSSVALQQQQQQQQQTTAAAVAPPPPPAAAAVSQTSPPVVLPHNPVQRQGVPTATTSSDVSQPPQQERVLVATVVPPPVVSQKNQPSQQQQGTRATATPSVEILQQATPLPQPQPQPQQGTVVATVPPAVSQNRPPQHHETPAFAKPSVVSQHERVASEPIVHQTQVQQQRGGTATTTAAVVQQQQPQSQQQPSKKAPFDWSKYALTPKHLREHETLQTGDWVRIHGRTLPLNGWVDLQVVKFFPGERSPVLMSDDGRLRLSAEVTKLYPPSSTTSSAAPIPEAPIGWQIRKNCPNRPIREFQILGEDGETIVLEMTNQQQGGTATAAVVQQTQPPPQPKPYHGTVPVATVPPVVSQNPSSLQQGSPAAATPSVEISQQAPPPLPQPQPQHGTVLVATVPPPVVSQIPPSLQQGSQAAATPAVVSQSSVSPQNLQHLQEYDLSEGVTKTVDPSIYGNIANWPCPNGYTPWDVYQGVHPRQRRVPQPHTYYPLCKVYEHITTPDLVKLVWQIDSGSTYEESMSATYLQSLTELNPKLIWILDCHDVPKPVAEAFKSPNNSMFLSPSFPSSTTPLDTSSVNHDAVLIDLSTSDGPDTTSTVMVEGNSADSANKDPEEDVGSAEEEAAAVLPSSRREYEKSTYDSLKVLYTEAFKFPYREVSVGGRVVQLDCFHYVDSTNACQPEYNNKRAGKFELIAKGEQVFIYRWEIKACILTRLRMVDKKLGERVFFSFARYGSMSTSKLFDCCAIMIVRCVNRTPVFLMMEVSSDPAIENDIQRWEGYDQIKNFYCMPEISIDYDNLSRARLRYWDMNRHIYDESRLIQIDTHRPSDMGVEKATPAQVEQSFKYWTIRHGPRDVIADTVAQSKESATTKCVERTAFLKEKSESVAKVKRISELELLVAKLTKANDQQKAKASAKQPSVSAAVSPVVFTRDNTTTGKKRSSSGSIAYSSEGSTPSPNYQPQYHHQYSPLQVPHPGYYASFNQQLQAVGSSAPSQYQHYPSHPVPPPVNVYNQHNVSSAALSVDSNASIMHNNQWSDELRRKDFEVSLKEKRLKALELDMEAARKELAVRAIQKQTRVVEARADLELQSIHAEKREMLHEAKSRQQYLNDQNISIRYQQLSEDRLFSKEAIRRSWQFEDREQENNARRSNNRDIMEMAAKAHDPTVLQSILYAQKNGYPTPPYPAAYPPPYHPQPSPQFPPPHNHQPPPQFPPPHNHHLPPRQPHTIHYHSSPAVIPPMPIPPPMPRRKFSAAVLPVVPVVQPFVDDHEETPDHDDINNMFPELHSSNENAKSGCEGIGYENMSSQQIEEFLRKAQEQLEAEKAQL